MPQDDLPLSEQAVAGAPAPAAAPAPAPKAAKEVKVRVLTACAYGKANDVAVIPGGQLKAAKADGLVDDEPAAVAYAQSLAKAQADGSDVIS